MKLLEALLYEKFELEIDEDLNFDENKQNVSRDFINYCCDELDLKGMFLCKIVSNRDAHNIKTTAFYDNGNELIVVYGKNRMLGDILRSIAHELVHKMQFQQNRINFPVQDVGGEIEDEANARAGSLIKKFIYTNENGHQLFE